MAENLISIKSGNDSYFSMFSEYDLDMHLFLCNGC